MAKGEVLIVGAGPTGLLLAVLLQEQQVPFKIINKKSGPTGLSKALAIHARTMELFKDIGIEDRFIEAGLPMKGVKMQKHTESLGHVDFHSLDSDFNYINVVPQSVTEKILIERLEELGVEIRWNTELCEFEEKGSEVIVGLKHVNEPLVKESYSWVVGCDGMHSIIREKNNISFKGTDLPEALSFADLKVHGDIPRDYVTIAIAKNGDGIIFFIPMLNGMTRLIVNNCNITNREEANNEYFNKVIQDRYDEKMTISDIAWSTVFHINYREAAEFVKWPFFLAGDAAHVHSPMGGQGMNTGLQDAYNLAWKLSTYIHGEAGRKLVDTYQEERHPNAVKLLKMSKMLTQVTAPKHAIFKWLRPYFIKFILNQKWVRNLLIDRLSQHNVNYRGKSLSKEFKASIFTKKGRHFNKGPRAGDRAVDCKIQVAKKPEIKTVLDLLRGSNTHDFIFIHNAKNLAKGGLSEIKMYENFKKIKSSHIVRNLIVRNKDFLENEKEYLSKEWTGNIIIDEDGSLHKAYHAEFPCIYIIRPDNYIGLKSKNLKFHNIRNYMVGILFDK